MQYKLQFVPDSHQGHWIITDSLTGAELARVPDSELSETLKEIREGTLT